MNSNLSFIFFSIYSGFMSKQPISIPAHKPNTPGKKYVSGSGKFRIERISEFDEEFGIERICFSSLKPKGIIKTSQWQRNCPKPVTTPMISK
jgi:hypothetical protein